MLTFVTSNQEKIKSAKRNLEPLGVSFEIQELEVPEIQSDSMEEIAKYKAEKAFEILKKPLFVSDHGWFITSLNGFPGPYMRYMNKWLTPKDFLNLTAPYKNKEVIKKEAICYIDKREAKVFLVELKGRILPEPKGQGYSATQIFCMNSAGKSIAQCENENINASDNDPIWEQLANYLKTTEGIF